MIKQWKNSFRKTGEKYQINHFIEGGHKFGSQRPRRQCGRGNFVLCVSASVTCEQPGSSCDYTEHW